MSEAYQLTEAFSVVAFIFGESCEIENTIRCRFYIFLMNRKKNWLSQVGISSKNVIFKILEHTTIIARFRFPHLIAIFANDHIKLNETFLDYQNFKTIRLSD